MPEKDLANGIEYNVSIQDNGTIVEALSAIDKELFDNPNNSVFPMYKGLIRSYLQLIWDPENNIIYEDCATNAYGPKREFIPLQDDINFNLYPDSDITLVVHAD